LKRSFLLLFFLTLFLFSPYNSVAEEIPPSFIGSKVKEKYTETLHRAPKNSEAHYFFWRSLVKEGDFSRGIEELLKVYPARSEEPDINWNPGVAYLKTDRFQ